ncbi:MAG TPA: STAS domain-containing protein [Candidatus Polarisedimenticolaceae bacterium]|nr:STAS domain-containing protein [Candidatus Polarisedimenticolaceae bacterium]
MRVQSSLADVLAERQQVILRDWIQAHAESGAARPDLVSDQTHQAQCAAVLDLLERSVRAGEAEARSGPNWNKLQDMLTDLSKVRARQGFSPSETARFVLSLKQPLFGQLRTALAKDGEALADAVWSTTALLDDIALLTTEAYQRGRDEIIRRQSQDLLELSTPVVNLWDGILALPIIGALDSGRTQVVMEALLEKLVESRSKIAIIDITGVPTVDTQVAQHLMKTVAAARLMGAECIISGIRPQIAQTIVHLGVDLGDVTTKGSLQAALAVALSRLGLTVVPR